MRVLREGVLQQDGNTPLIPESNFFPCCLDGKKMRLLTALTSLMQVQLYLDISYVIFGMGCSSFMISTKDTTTRCILPFLKRQGISKLLSSKRGLRTNGYLYVPTVECSIEEVEGTLCPTTLSTNTGVEYWPGWGSRKFLCVSSGNMCTQGTTRSMWQAMHEGTRRCGCCL